MIYCLFSVHCQDLDVQESGFTKHNKSASKNNNLCCLVMSLCLIKQYKITFNVSCQCSTLISFYLNYPRKIVMQ